jgi:leucyl aminopeptidase (aminopeptidase T)
MRVRAEETLAREVLTEYLGLRSGETVTVEAWSHALPWARAFVVEARRLGADPLLAVEDEEAFFQSLATLPTRRLPSAPASLAVSSDAYVYFGGPEEFPRLFGIGPADLRAVLGRHDPAWRNAARTARMRVARLGISAATTPAAHRYGVDLDGWRSELIAASSVGPDRLARAAHPLLRRLARARRIRVRHANGTDVSAELVPGAIRVDDGRSARGPPRYSVEVPTGRIVLPLRTRSAQGRWEANRALYDRYSDAPVQLGAQFRLARGALDEFSFDRGGEAFAIAYAAGGRRRDAVEALVVGLNPKISRAPETAELAAGTISLVLGGNLELGGRNRAPFSRISSLAGADVTLDDRPWISAGRPVD